MIKKAVVNNGLELQKGATLREKLVSIQAILNVPKNQFNKFGGYKFRSCEDILTAIKPLLQQTDLTLLLNDEILFIGTRYYVNVKAVLSDGKESIITTAIAREDEIKKGMDVCQITGSASSYARKYALNGMFLIDDAKDSDHTNVGEEIVAEKNPVMPNTKTKPIERIKGKNKEVNELLDTPRKNLTPEEEVDALQDAIVKQANILKLGEVNLQKIANEIATGKWSDWTDLAVLGMLYDKLLRKETSRK